MNILIDTSVWSLGLRRRRRDLNPQELRAYFEWEQLLRRGQAAIIGSIRQEVLSGIISQKEFKSLEERLALINDLPLPTEIFILGADFYNRCRTDGIIPGAIDMTICAAADFYNIPIFSIDPDFDHYVRCLPIRLYKP